MSTHTRRAHTRVVNGRTIQVRESRPVTRTVKGATVTTSSWTAKKRYRRSTWVAATGIGMMVGAGKMINIGGGSPMAKVAVAIGLVLLVVAGVMRLVSLALEHRR